MAGPIETNWTSEMFIGKIVLFARIIIAYRDSVTAFNLNPPLHLVKHVRDNTMRNGETRNCYFTENKEDTEIVYSKAVDEALKI